MTHVITQPCCADAACVPVCPVDCIHPAPGEPDFMTADLLYIDPGTCVDCGLCAKACPVDAIVRDYHLTEGSLPFKELNAAYYQGISEPAPETPAPRPPARPDPNLPAPRVAIVGSGPAAMFAADELQRRLRARIDMFERLPEVGGLIRYGVAPDHPRTKQAADVLDRVVRAPGFRLFVNVEVGRTIGHDELSSHYHAVIYATGAFGGRRLGVPGEDLPGSCTAAEFVGWYNGHADHPLPTLDLSTERAVVIGNGNVALDIARILLSDPARLQHTDIADRALNLLAGSAIREVVLVGRRGITEVAGTAAELIGLGTTPGLTVRADLTPEDQEKVEAAGRPIRELKTELIRHAVGPATDRIARFTFHQRLAEVLGDTSVTGVRLTPTAEARSLPQTESVLDCGLVIAAIGFDGSRIDGLPFDATTGTIRHVGGRVEPGDESGRGVYVAGWIKRGSSGGIGQNKRCAEETVDALVADYEAGRLRPPDGGDIAARLPGPGR